MKLVRQPQNTWNRLKFLMRSDQRTRSVSARGRLVFSRASLATIGLIGIFSARATAGTEIHRTVVMRQDVPLAAYDELASNELFRCVGVVTINSGKSAIASGVLIAPNWILTAAHVMRNDDGADKFDNVFRHDSEWHDALTVTSGTNIWFRLPELPYSYGVVEWLPYPEFDGSFGSGWDIGLMAIGPFGGAGVPAAELYEGTNEIGQVGVWVGCGKIGWGPGVETYESGNHRYAAENVLDADGSAVGFYGLSQDPIGRYFTEVPTYWGFYHRAYVVDTHDSIRTLAADFDNPDEPRRNWFGSPEPLPREGGNAPGDSGGGVFITDKGRTELAGVISATSGEPPSYYGGRYGTIFLATRISPFVGWVKDQLSYAGLVATNGQIVSFDTPDAWYTFSATEGLVANSVPRASHCVVIDLKASDIEQDSARDVVWGTEFYLSDGNIFSTPLRLQTGRPKSVRCTIKLDRDRCNSRLRVRAASDLTLDFGGHTYSLTSTSSYSPAVIVGQAGYDDSVLTITNGVLKAFDASIGQATCLGRPDADIVYGRPFGGGVVNLLGNGTAWLLNDSLYVGGRKTGPGGVGALKLGSYTKLSVGGVLKLLFWKRFGDVNQGAFDVCGTMDLDRSSLVTADTFEIAGGVLKGTGDIQVTNVSKWTGGILSGRGALDALGGIKITGGMVSNAFIFDYNVYWPSRSLPNEWEPPDRIYDPNCGIPRGLTLEGWSITNHSTATFEGSLDLVARGNAWFENLSSATFEVEVDRSLIGSARFQNEGLFRKSGGTNTAAVAWDFSNTGSLEVGSGRLMLEGWVPQLATSTLSTGRWSVLNNSSLVVTQGRAIHTNNATILLNGACASFTNIDTLEVNEGSFTLQNNRVFNAITNFANSGTISISGGSQLYVHGGFQQAGSGRLLLELENVAVSSPKIVSEAPVLLAGELKILSRGQLTVPEDVEIISYPSKIGTFEAIVTSSLLYATVSVLYSETNVVIRLSPSQAPAITGFLLTGNGDAAITWRGGTPPYTVQRARQLVSDGWRDASGLLFGTHYVLPLTNDASFFRVISK